MTALSPPARVSPGGGLEHINFHKFLAWSGVVCVALFFGAFVVAGFIPPLAPNSSAASIARFYQTHTTGIRIGSVLMLISGMFYATWTAVISAQMRRIPRVSTAAVYTQLCAGAFACLTFLVPAMLFMVTAFRPHRNPEITLTLNDMSYIFLIIPWPPFMAQMFAFSYSILMDKQARPLFPRWLGYLNIWWPLMISPSTLLPFFKTGPFDWRGLLVLWIPAIGFIGQFVAGGAMLVRAIDREADELRGAPEPAVAQAVPTAA